ncbi:Trehalose-6-P synthase/phosphatase complex synthase subunit [Knufia peltigerae]|uniref:Trehalose-6-P synthase/phosphatase complex synthase subunit n=1 Tax=Knufia peltigerae TaxID=1002370 RepID=A0AA38XYL9_9EURO|nr:Trehalose-6-P synthase/phosphatase complex synthase subunit [Knufia peltigerae]
MYAASDVCFVSSIRDGMNLVSYEYVATQRFRRGVLLLSEFAGAAEALRGSVSFNPWDVNGTVDALGRALTMEMHERSVNHEKSEEYVWKNSSAVWGKSFVSDLKRSRAKALAAAASATHIRDMAYEVTKAAKKNTPSPDCGPIGRRRRRSILLRRETS